MKEGRFIRPYGRALLCAFQGNQRALRRYTQFDSSSAERWVTAACCLLLVVQATSLRSTLTGIRQLRGWMPLTRPKDRSILLLRTSNTY